MIKPLQLRRTVLGRHLLLLIFVLAGLHSCLTPLGKSVLASEHRAQYQLVGQGFQSSPIRAGDGFPSPLRA